MAPAILDYTANRHVAERMGNKCPYAAPHDVYPCAGKDTWCAISVFTDAEWKSLCNVIGSPQLANDTRFATLTARKEHEEELDKLISTWTQQRQPVDVMNLMQAAGVPAGLCETADYQMETDPQLKARKYFFEIKDTEGEIERGNPGVQFMLSKSSIERKGGSELGDDNDYVYKQILGLSDVEIAELVKEKVID